MKNAVSINNQNLQVKEYEGKRVVTFKEIDAVHQRPNGTARRSFNENKDKFIVGEDYFVVSANEIRTQNIMDIDKRLTQYVVFVTYSGYLMLTKSFTDDLAWRVQRELVNSYFNSKQPQQMSLPEPYEYKPKYFRGMQVVSVADLSHFMGVSAFIIRDCLKRHKNSFIEGVDFWNLKGEDLTSFKVNNRLCKTISSLLIFTESGFKKLNKLMGNAPVAVKCFEKPSASTELHTQEPEKLIELMEKQIDGMKVLLDLCQQYNNSKFRTSILESMFFLSVKLTSNIHVYTEI